MVLTPVDWAVIALYFALNLGIGFYFMRRASGDVGEFFLSGRNVPWWLAGTSMVATTFGADTPLVVTGFIYKQGIMPATGSGGRFCALRHAHRLLLSPRCGAVRSVLTDIEFAELRYAGPARQLPPWLPGGLPRVARQHHHHGLGEPGHGQGAYALTLGLHTHPSSQLDGSLRLPRTHARLQRHLGPLGGAMDRRRTVHPEDVTMVILTGGLRRSCSGRNGTRLRTQSPRL